MYKIIKKIKNNSNNERLTYKLGLEYDIIADKVCPCIEIYKNSEWVSTGQLNNRDYDKEEYIYDFSSFSVYISYIGSTYHINTIEEMFIKLREYSKIPEEVEKEFESLFLMYKMNDFKKI